MLKILTTGRMKTGGNSWEHVCCLGPAAAITDADYKDWNIG